MEQNAENIQQALFLILGPHHSYQHQKVLPNLEKLKKAYHKKAMLYHPDRSVVLGKNEQSAAEEFKKLNHAYRLLLSLIETKKRITFTNPRFRAGAHTNKHFHSANKHNYHRQHRFRKTPRFRMRLALFLYLKRVITWKTMIDALIWQTSNRPRVGQLGIKYNYISRPDILNILRNRIPGERFCETALRLNLINRIQANTILYVQKSYNIPIGKYFIDNKLLSEEQISNYLAELEEYNLRFY